MSYFEIRGLVMVWVTCFKKEFTEEDVLCNMGITGRRQYRDKSTGVHETLWIDMLIKIQDDGGRELGMKLEIFSEVLYHR